MPKEAREERVRTTPHFDTCKEAKNKSGAEANRLVALLFLLDGNRGEEKG